jgi:hypothetical protein
MDNVDYDNLLGLKERPDKQRLYPACIVLAVPKGLTRH